MNTFIRKYNIKPGDVIICPKSSLNIVEHYVVYLGENEWGNDIYAENKVGHGVRIISHHQFVSDNPSFNRIRRFSGNNLHRNLAIERAISLIGSKYDVTIFNCEHFANYIQNSQVRSKQVETVLTLAGIATILLVVGATVSANK